MKKLPQHNVLAGASALRALGLNSPVSSANECAQVAVKKLPQLGPEQPLSEALYEGLLREIQLASKFDCDRWGIGYERQYFNTCLSCRSGAG